MGRASAHLSSSDLGAMNTEVLIIHPEVCTTTALRDFAHTIDFVRNNLICHRPIFPNHMTHLCFRHCLIYEGILDP